MPKTMLSDLKTKKVNRARIVETLEKQLQLLSERSEKVIEDKDLSSLTCAMDVVIERLLTLDGQR